MNDNFRDTKIRAKIRQICLEKYGTENWTQSEEGRTALSNQVKTSWGRAFQKAETEEPYTLSETIEQLVRGDFWKTLEGKAKNRTLLKNDPKLYKSIYIHSNILEQKMKDSKRYASSYNFSHRLRFLVEYGGDIEKLRCECGQRYSWTGHCRHCSEASKIYSRMTEEEKAARNHKASQTMRLRVGAELYKEGKSPRYDLESIELLEAFGKSLGLNLQHAENGGEIYLTELGYWLDGYDREQNVAVEIDEPYHFRKDLNLIEKDQRRHKLIQEHLGCKIYHIYFNKRTNRTVLYNSPDQPDNWDVNQGIELTEFESFAKNGTKRYNKYMGTKY